MGNQTASWSGSWQEPPGLQSLLVHGMFRVDLYVVWYMEFAKEEILQTMRCKEDLCAQHHGKSIDNPDAATTRLAFMDIKHVVSPSSRQAIGL